ncbi:conjugal transfer protein TrbI [Sphingomonas sp. SRS2]|nr:conjugal transfer protein TrbI [Sphingomonas sp. SRS2]
MTDLSETPAPPPKVDPETLAIRSHPMRSVRFKRRLIIGLAAAGSAGLMGVTWAALSTTRPIRLAPESDLSQPLEKPSSDTLAALPTAYGSTPQLGPPLPGDLGRPILRRQQLDAQADSSTDAGSGGGTSGGRSVADERKAARASGVLFQRGITSAADRSAYQDSGFGSDAMPNPGDAFADPNGQIRKAQFVAANGQAEDVDSHRLKPAASPYLLSAGSIVSASLITGLRSDLPGLVTAQVTENVFDSPTGQILLIPQGARLVGSYDSVIAFGQSRALVVWQRIVMPDGSSLRIDNVPATDTAGYSGLADKVDRHSWSLLKGVVLSTLLGVGSELAFSSDSDLVQAIRRSTQDSGSRAGDQIVGKNLNIQPTITVRPGAVVRLVVHKDLILVPWKG